MGPLIAKHRGLLVGGVLLIRTELLPSKNRNRRASTSISCGLFRIEELSLLTKSNQRMRGGARDWLKTISAPRRWWCFSEDCNQSDRARLRYSLPAKKRQTQQRCNEQRVCGRFWHWTSDELQSVHGITYLPRMAGSRGPVGCQAGRKAARHRPPHRPTVFHWLGRKPAPGPVRRGKDMGERVGNRVPSSHIHPIPVRDPDCAGHVGDTHGIVLHLAGQHVASGRV